MLDILSQDHTVVAAVLRQFCVFSPDLGAPEDAGDPVRLKKLEHLRILASVDPAWLYPIIQHATKLNTLELGGSYSRPGSGPTRDPIKYFEPATLPTTIRTVGMHQFRWSNKLSYHTPYTGRPFLEWVAKFPVVPETIACYPQHFEAAGETVLALVRMEGVKTIFQDCLRGPLRDEALQEAERRGVVIHHTTKPYRPSPAFPWPNGE